VSPLARIVGAGGLAFVLAACAAAANTPEQELAYARWARCGAPYTQLERVDVDGRITFLFSNSATRLDVEQCLADAARAGSALPAPLAVRPVGGP
jgi:hypothetical protein